MHGLGTIENSVTVAVCDVDLCAVEVLIEVGHAVIVEVSDSIGSIIRIQPCCDFDVVRDSISVRVNEFLTANIDRTGRAGYSIYVFGDQVFIVTGINAWRTGFQITHCCQHWICSDISGAERTPIRRIIVVLRSERSILGYFSGDDRIFHRCILLEVDATSVPAASVCNCYVIKVRLEIIHVKIGIIVNGPISYEQTVLHCQNTRRGITSATIGTIASADCAAIIETVVVDETGVSYLNLTSRHDDGAGSITAVSDELAVVDNAAIGIDQIQRTGVTASATICGFPRCVIAEDAVGYADWPALRINRRRCVGILPVFFVPSFTIIIANQFAGIIVLKNAIPNVHTGVIEINTNAIARRVAVTDGEAVQPARDVLFVLQRQERPVAFEVDDR